MGGLFLKWGGVLNPLRTMKIKLFTGAILPGVSNEPEAYLEPSQTSMGSVFVKIVKDYRLLTIFAKKTSIYMFHLVLNMLL